MLVPFEKLQGFKMLIRRIIGNGYVELTWQDVNGNRAVVTRKRARQ